MADIRRSATRGPAALLQAFAVVAFLAAVWPGGEGARAQPPGAGEAPPAPLPPGSDPIPPGFQPPPPPPQRAGPGSLQPSLTPPNAGPGRFPLKIAEDAPLSELLPPPPEVKKAAGPVLDDDLTRVPEVQFQAPLSKDLQGTKALEQTAHTVAKINHLNAKKTDAFMHALLEKRSDLSGLPMAMGDDCRTSVERSKHFNQAVATIRSALNAAGATNASPVTSFGPPDNPRLAPPDRPKALPPMARSSFQMPAGGAGRPAAASFWDQYRSLCAEEDRATPRIDRAVRDHITHARVAALLQVIGPEQPSLRLGMVRHLATVSHVEATKALGRLAIYSPEAEVREAAVEALRVRREADYTVILTDGLRYPWPAVAKRAADAIVKLERKDLLPQLVDVLDATDPRAPVKREVRGRRAEVVRELVKVNHHRNCLLCHAPVNPSAGAPAEVLTAEVPRPNEPLQSFSSGYGNSHQDMLVRIDVVYLRQDFSAMQAVKDAHPWPEAQRFDFVVRSRELTEAEAAAWAKQINKREEGYVSPYQRAALHALRELTGKDTAPTAEAWRRLLSLPAARRQPEVSLLRLPQLL